MILLFLRDRLDAEAGRSTPLQLAAKHKRVRLTPHVITRLPKQDYKPRHCDGVTCIHEHAGASRLPQIRIGRRWIA